MNLLIFSLLLAYFIVKFLNLRPQINVLNCGISGYVGKNPIDTLKARMLMFANRSRGIHSAGAFGVGGEDPKIIKKACDPYDFIINGYLEKSISGQNNVIMHTRAATTGSKNDKNAHPFEFGEGENKVVGTHNGTVFDGVVTRLAKDNGFEKPEVDSEIIYMMLHKYNYDYQVLSEIEGLMALAFIRPHYPEYLFLYRRESKPLHVGWEIDGDSTNLWYSSEPSPLWLIDCSKVRELSSHTMYVFNAKGLVEAIPVKKPVITNIRTDQPISEWAKTASKTEKERIGIGTEAVTAGSTPKTANTVSYNKPSIGYDYTKGAAGGTQKQLSFLEDITRATERMWERGVDSPVLGNYISAGNSSSCYLAMKLQDSQTGHPLIGFNAILTSCPTQTSVSCHNGIMILEVPAKYCKSKVELRIHHPLIPDRSYNCTINNIKSGRILEVVLNLPFLISEEETTKNNSKIDYRKIIHGKYGGNGEDAEIPFIFEKQNDGDAFGGLQVNVQPSSFSNTGESARELQRRHSEGCDSSVDDECTSRGSCDISDYKCNVDNLFGCDPDFELENDIYNDIMDLNTSELHLKEIEDTLKTVRESLSSLALSADEKITTLNKVSNLLEWQASYFGSRVQHLNERDNAFNTEDVNQ